MALENYLALASLVACCAVVYALGLRSDLLAITIVVLTLAYILWTWSDTLIIGSDEPVSSREVRSTNCILLSVDKHACGLSSGGCLDVWHVKHAALWLLLGLLSPGRYILAACVSVLWELFEHATFAVRGLACSPSGFCGRFEDPAINILAYVAGSYLAMRRCRG